MRAPQPDPTRSPAPAPAGGGARSLCVLFAFLAFLAFLLPVSSAPLQAQSVPLEDLEAVVPEADRFSEKEGEPPVYRAFRTDPSTEEEELVGFAFLTSDAPPEVMGYDAPIDVLVGLDLEGELTGVRVMRYRESLQRSRGHFLGRRGFQEQFSGKSVTDPFRVGRDVENISGATITVDAMSRGIRNAARRIATVHLPRAGAGEAAETEETSSAEAFDVETMREATWAELVSGGPVQRLTVLEDGRVVRLELFLLHLWTPEVGTILLGDRYDALLEEAGDRMEGKHPLFLGMEGSTIRFRPYMLFAVQGADTFAVENEDVLLVDNPRDGAVADQVESAGLWLMDGEVDVSRPFTVVFGGELGMDVFSTEHPATGEPQVMAEAPSGDPSAEPEDDSAPGEEDAEDAESSVEDSLASRPGEESGGADPEEVVPPETSSEEAPAREDEGGTGAAAGETDGIEDPAPPPGEAPAAAELDFGQWDLEAEEESQLARTLSRTSWSRVGGLALLIALATFAFFTKATALRWVTLSGTILYLGFLHGGFLSVSHITSAVGVGPAIFLNDLALLLIVLFTLVTTLLWGRVFCGYLCPFGALQDVLDRVVPQRLRRSVPARIHDRALLVKYGVLLVVLAPVLVGSQIRLYHFFEPFGTVFFLSASIPLWAIAIVFLGASAVVPRFYCRYACPLGAALAVVSRVSPFRIRRVEQCSVCKVCEQSCPTGAIRGPEVDFPECVRCSVCEVKLLERAGSCRHDMERIRPRLVQLQVGTGEGAR